MPTSSALPWCVRSSTTPGAGLIPVADETGKLASGWLDAAPGGGTPSDTVVAETSPGQQSAAGSASTYSRGDHTHGTPADGVPAHASVTSSVHGFDASGNAPAQSHDNTRHSTAYATAADLSSHAGAASPHSGHEVTTAKGTAGGYAALDSGTLVPVAQLGTGTPSGAKYLRDDRSWQTPPGGGGNPSWWGVLYSTSNDCNPLEYVREWGMTSVAGPTPTAITTALARCSLFRPPADMAVQRVRLFGVGATTGLYKFAIYPRGTGSARLWESGAVNSASNTWLAISAGCPFSLVGGNEYWFCVTVTTTGTTAGFRSMPAPPGSNFFGADEAPLGGRGLSLPTFCQFAVSAGAFPATLPAVAKAAYSAGSTGSVPFALLDSIA